MDLNAWEYSVALGREHSSVRRNYNASFDATRHKYFPPRRPPGERIMIMPPPPPPQAQKPFSPTCPSHQYYRIITNYGPPPKPSYALSPEGQAVLDFILAQTGKTIEQCVLEGFVKGLIQQLNPRKAIRDCVESIAQDILDAMINEFENNYSQIRARASAIKAERLRKEQEWQNKCSCLLYTSPSPRDRQKSRMPSSA